MVIVSVAKLHFLRKMVLTKKEWRKLSLVEKYGTISSIITIFSPVLSVIFIYVLVPNLGSLFLPEAKASQKIVLANARYGFNDKRDHTDWFANRCEGLSECEFSVMLDRELGDHEHFVEKELSIMYHCENGEQNKIFYLPPAREPARRPVSLACS